MMCSKIIAISIILILPILECLAEVKLNERMLTSYQPCKDDGDCKENSLCDLDSKLCRCHDNYLLIRQRQSYECLLPATSIDSPCTRDEQCEFRLGRDSECNAQKKCACMPDAHFVRDKNSCYKTAGLNETCIEHANCVPNFPDDEVFCTNGRCTCGLKQRPNAAGRCATVRRLGEPCEMDDVCRSMNAVCRVVCTCKVGYVLEENERYCLPAALHLYEPCSQQSQCERYVAHSECVRGRCQCQQGYHQFGERCYRPRSVGSLCTERGECVTRPDLEGRVDCVDLICTCAHGLDDTTCGDRSATMRIEYFTTLHIIGIVCSIVVFLLI